MIRFFDNDTLEPIFETAAPTLLEVKQEKRATRFAVETGAIRSDHVIDMPLEIPVELQLWGKEAQEGYDALKDYYDRRALVSIETNMDIYMDMLIEAQPHIESSENFLGATVSARFLQWTEIEPEYGELLPRQVKSKEHASTKKGAGYKEEVPERKRSALHKMFGTETSGAAR